jgi:hypothetical protein
VAKIPCKKNQGTTEGNRNIANFQYLQKGGKTQKTKAVTVKAAKMNPRQKGDELNGNLPKGKELVH